MNDLRLYRWVVLQERNNGKRQILNLLEEKNYNVKEDSCWRLLRALEEKKDLRQAVPELSREEIQDILEELEDKELIRRGRILFGELGTFYLSLWEPRRIRGETAAPFFLDIARMILWLPMLMLGVRCVWTHSFSVYGGSVWMGIFLGVLTGSILHELAHAVSALRWGGYVFECGVFLKLFLLPGMYVLIQEKPVKSRIRRILIDGAGIEMNLLLCGLFLMLSTVMEPWAETFFGAASTNAIMGLLNFLPGSGLDGAHMLENLLGSREAAEQAKQVIRSRDGRKKLTDRGITGSVELAACGILALTGMIIPMLMILQFAEVIWLWFCG